MIKNIIFDLGVVLLDVNYAATIRAFSKLGLEKAEDAFSKHKQDEFFRKYERGLMSSDQFLSGLAERMKFSDQVGLEEAWCKMLGELPIEKFELVKELNNSYRLFILSNTNEIHQNWFEKKIDEQYGWVNFERCFDFIGYSHQINERKPDSEAFLKIVERFELNLAQTLFVDDTFEHVQAARKLGLSVIHYKEDMNLRTEITNAIEANSTSS
jgi:putative hydrolase of the HAD superfamily